jgi:hypothetical protein
MVHLFTLPCCVYDYIYMHSVWSNLACILSDSAVVDGLSGDDECSAPYVCSNCASCVFLSPRLLICKIGVGVLK